ncbi:MAG: hypothetical protein WCG91_02980 [Candidatus Shapirobacteria bacterium]
MKNKFLIFSFLIVSALVFSGCTLKDQAESKVLNKINNKVDQKIEENSKDVVNKETGDDSEAEILKQIDADTDTGFEAELKSLDTEAN